MFELADTSRTTVRTELVYGDYFLFSAQLHVKELVYKVVTHILNSI